MKRDIIVLGASAGGLEALRTLVAQFPADFPASVFVVWHLSRDFPSQLAQILGRSAILPVSQAEDGEAIRPGHIYVAQPNHHLLIEDDHIRVSRGPTENRFRPSVDVLFRSAALAKDSRVIAVVLSGSLDDGASGSYAIKQRGGIVVVQDPVEAPYFDMPINVMKTVEVDYVKRLDEMGALLSKLVKQSQEGEEGTTPSRQLEIEVQIAREDNALESGVMELGEPSKYTCPECHGTLLQIKEGKRLRFRCHTGHAFSMDSLLAEVSQNVEDTLWSGVRVIEESLMLLQHMAKHLLEADEPEAAQLFLQKAEKARQQAETVRQVAMSSEVLSEENIRQPSPPEE